MDAAIRDALARNQTIDITTTGRHSQTPRRIEIVVHNVDRHLYISGIPSRRTRGWIHNLNADPRMVVHLKRGTVADLEATGRVITDEAERRSVLPAIARNWGRGDLDAMIAHSPLIEVTVPGYPD